LPEPSSSVSSALVVVGSVLVADDYHLLANALFTPAAVEGATSPLIKTLFTIFIFLKPHNSIKNIFAHL